VATANPSPVFNYSFVVQQHKSKSNHWDFRLQVGNSMYSWAIPKGPSLNPREARLAVETAPHSIAYSGFEGVISKGLYGAGKVMLWDAGKYSGYANENEIKDGIRSGILKFELDGEKLKGRWALVRTGENWILIKANDKYASKTLDIVKHSPLSVKSHKSIAGITEDDGLIMKRTDLGW